MSASVSVGGFESKGTIAANVIASPLEEQIAMADNALVDEITTVDDDIEIIDTSFDIANDSLDDVVDPLMVGDEVLDGFQDPIMPFLILGVFTLIAIFTFAIVLVF